MKKIFILKHEKFLIILIILIMLLLLMWFLYYFFFYYNYGRDVNKPIPENSSIEDLCDIAMAEAAKIKRFDKFNLAVGKIELFNGDRNLKSNYIYIYLVEQNPQKEVPYKLIFTFNNITNKYENIQGGMNLDALGGSIGMNYENWKITSMEAVQIYMKYFKEYYDEDINKSDNNTKQNKECFAIYGYYDEINDIADWQISDMYNPSDNHIMKIDAYTGEIIEIF